MRKLFISYARVDEIRVVDLVNILRLGGFDPWWDDQLEAGDDWKESLAQKIARCDGFVCVLSPDFIGSEWCQWELAQASEQSKPIVPVLVRGGATLPPALARLHYLDASEGIAASVAARLIGKLSRLKQDELVDHAALQRTPRGLPSRLKRPLPKDYRTLGQAYFQPVAPGMSLYAPPAAPAGRRKRQLHPTIPGIDFGTTESSIAVCVDGVVRLIPNRFGDTSTGSAVAIAPDGLPLVGVEAMELLSDRPERGVLEVKRLLGLEPADCREVLVIDDIAYTAVQLASFLFRRLRLDAEAYLDAAVSEVVLTAPAYFGPDQFAALNEAAALAGLEVVRVIPEPVAACMALAHGRDRSGMPDQTWMIYDLGGGTFDASIVDFYTVDRELQFKVLAVNGDTRLGGADYDRVLVDYCVAEFLNSTGVDVSGDPTALMKIRKSVERAKISLSCETEAAVRVSALALTGQGALDLHLSLSRQLCTELTQHLSAETFRLTRMVLADAGKAAGEVDNALVVGRAARAAGVAIGLQDLFPQGLHYAVDHVVALGAALQGGVLSRHVKDALLLEATTRTLRLELANGRAVPLIPRNHMIPWREDFGIEPDPRARGPLLIRLSAGESSWAARNALLAELVVSPDQLGRQAWTLKLVIDANSMANVELCGGDVVLGQARFGLRKTCVQRASIAEGGFPSGASFPELLDSVILDPVGLDICTDRVGLRRWIALAASELVLARVGPHASTKEFGWLALNDWLVQHPDEDVPDSVADALVFVQFSKERELLIDALEQCFDADLRPVRHHASIASLAAAVMTWWHDSQAADRT